MKKTIKFAALLMALALVICAFAACGGSKDPEPANDDGNDTPATEAPAADDGVKGTVEEHGYYTVLVPEGYTLKHEDVFGDNDPKSFNINLNDSSFTYFMFNLYSKDNAESSIEMTKSMNEGASDVSVVYNGVTWTGVAYDSLGIACFSLIASFGEDDYVIVSGAGNAYDSAITDAVLSSLTVTVPAE